jgi:hypothetical protein
MSRPRTHFPRTIMIQAGAVCMSLTALTSIAVRSYVVTDCSRLTKLPSGESYTSTNRNEPFGSKGSRAPQEMYRIACALSAERQIPNRSVNTAEPSLNGMTYLSAVAYQRLRRLHDSRRQFLLLARTAEPPPAPVRSVFGYSFRRPRSVRQPVAIGASSSVVLPTVDRPSSPLAVPA